MDLLHDLKKAIYDNDDSTIDTLLYISKIETLKNNTSHNGSLLFDRVESMVKDFYSKKYKMPYSKEAALLYGYIGKEIDKEFYDLNEISFESRELLTDKIMKRMKQIKNSSCSFDYKLKALLLLNIYLEELSPTESHWEANVMLGKMVFKKILIRLLFLLFLSFPFWLPNLAFGWLEAVEGTPKELIYHGAITTVCAVLVFGTALVYIHLKGLVKKETGILFLTAFVVFSSMLFHDYMVDIRTDIAHFREETVVFQRVIQSPNHKNSRYAVAKREDGSKETLTFHSDLDLESGKQYTIKYNQTRIIVEARDAENGE